MGQPHKNLFNPCHICGAAWYYCQCRIGAMGNSVHCGICHQVRSMACIRKEPQGPIMGNAKLRQDPLKADSLIKSAIREGQEMREAGEK